MKKIRVLLASVTVMIFLSCGGEKKDGNAPIKQETPKALQSEEYTDVRGSWSRGNNLMEELYQELVDKTPELQKLETRIEALGPKTSELSQNFRDYDNKSQSYYGDAQNSAISDSILKKEILNLIKASQGKYSKKTSNLQYLLTTIYNNTSTVNDHHNALKIVLTLPLIEKYQDENMPNEKGYKDFINEQTGVIKQTDSLRQKQ